MATPHISAFGLIPLFFAFFFFQELCLSIPGLRFVVFGLLTMGSAHLIIHPPTTHAFINGSAACLSVHVLLRFIELALIHNAFHMKRIRRLPFSPFHSTSVYVWQSRPQELGLERIFWTLDLATNPRLVGWSHGPFYYWPPPHSILSQKEKLPGTATAIQAGRGTGRELSSTLDRSSFIRQGLRRILSNYLIVDIYQTWFASRRVVLCRLLQPTQGTINRLASAICIYAFLDGSNALLSFIAVGVLGPKYLGTGGDVWNWPPLFGSPRYLFRLNAADSWRGFWHDLLRPTQLSIATWLIPDTVKDTSLRSFLLAWFTYLMAGAAHCAATYAILQDIRATGTLLLFFLLQPICILMAFSWPQIIIRQQGMCQPWVQRFVKALATLAQVLCFYFSLPWMLDDPGILALLANIPIPGGLVKLLWG